MNTGRTAPRWVEPAAWTLIALCLLFILGMVAVGRDRLALIAPVLIIVGQSFIVWRVRSDRY